MHINFGDIPVFFLFFFFSSARYPFGRQPNFATDAKITLRFSMPRAYTLTERELHALIHMKMSKRWFYFLFRKQKVEVLNCLNGDKVFA